MQRVLLIFLLSFQVLSASGQRQPLFNIPDTTVRGRVWVMGLANAALYGGTLLALNRAWYRDYPKSSFHFINDNREWLQMDKFGHVFSAYLESKYSRELWRWTGLPRKQQIWIGGMSGFAYQSVIEILDGYSRDWGFSWGDMGANAIGSGLVISQELLWDQQRIQLKFSYFPRRYPDPVLEERSRQVFGNSFMGRMLKDYNSQTYWLSVNLSSFFPDGGLPRWLNIAVGYGADDMYGARPDSWPTADHPMPGYGNIRRYRQFYLSPDVDFTRIRTRSKGLKVLFHVLNMVKFPAPALELTSNGRFRVKALKF